MNGKLLAYNILQALLLPVIGPFLLAPRLLGRRNRSHMLSRLGKTAPIPETRGRFPRIWVHALSVGEAAASIPLVNALQGRFPGCGIICTATTPTGLETFRSGLKDGVQAILPAPFDIAPTIRSFVGRIKPECLVIVETDVWPNLTWRMKSLGIPTVLVNGSISSRSAARLARVKPIVPLLYGGLDHIAMQSGEDRERLLALGIGPEKVSAPGNLKYDMPLPDPLEKDLPDFTREIGLDPGRSILVLGSTHEGEEEPLLDSLRRMTKHGTGLQIIVAPREPARAAEILSLGARLGLRASRRSDQGVRGPVDLVVLDTLGELRRCYGIADMAFVGGSLVPVGGHNVLEPAAWGIPVIFGTHVESCREMARDLVACGGGIMIQDAAELASLVGRLVDDPLSGRVMGNQARAMVERNQGVVDRYLDLVGALLARGRTR